jgi:hypothetical protein
MNHGTSIGTTNDRHFNADGRMMMNKLPKRSRNARKRVASKRRRQMLRIPKGARGADVD